MTALSDDEKRRTKLEDDAVELAIIAQGLARAAELLAEQFTVVTTNVPYLGRGNQEETLKDYCERVYAEAKADLATCFVQRCLEFCERNGSAALVTPQNWFSQPRYKNLRTRLLKGNQWDSVARLGPGAFETIGGEVVTVSLIVLSDSRPPAGSRFVVLDVSEESLAADKATSLRLKSCVEVSQESQLLNPDAIITLDSHEQKRLLSEMARAWQGLVTGDDNKFYGVFWERPVLVRNIWTPVQQAPQESLPFTGRETVVRWEDGRGDLHLRSKT